MKNEFKGYPLFLNVKDLELRAKNRASTMFNIFEQYQYDEFLSKTGTSMLFGYFSQIPKEERKLVYQFLSGLMTLNGYRITPKVVYEKTFSNS